ncbi:hypothetical protein QO002_001920 [Pararhizobium capsulatum DSM 1112]|uniref:Uncharacterized protein n=1 Tax=Pararhizobium capsulatum DSM 1112 TaxID=1121113 RepID=A0ABU0BNE9_9HYPH|nr:hypothetical protein [Pararhizobium capsulatum]MDQ0319782.1 hypothetical protein [Pararhizobium capsulatum DSM 1112]
MRKERTQRTDVYRFRRVKWGNPRHQLTKLRNVTPAMAEGEREAAGLWFWIAVACLSAITFASVFLIATDTRLL